MKHMIAKFKSTCPETGIILKKGDPIVYDNKSRKAFHPTAPSIQQYPDQSGDIIQANEEAYFDNWASANL